jgi:magnesium transporter
MMNISRTNIVKLNEEERDLLEDLIVETSQALEMANTYTNILNSTLDAFASIISNNQNEVLKRLTTLTIFLSVPILIASIYGMNVPIPYKDNHMAFWLPVILSIVILGFAVWNYWKRLKK